METGYVCPECGGTKFRAEEHGWNVRGCRLTPDGAFDGYTDDRGFVPDDGGDSYFCENCNTEV